MTDEDRRAEATREFARGSEQYVAKRYGLALDALRASYRLVPSPNSMLLIARCLRALGRPTEAAESYQSAELEANRRNAEDPSYAQTASAARNEGAEVRTNLGSIRITIKSVRPGTRLLVDGLPVAIPPDRDVFLWRVPGAVAVRVSSPTGTDDTREIDVRAGSDTSLVFDGEPPATSVPEALARPSSMTTRESVPSTRPRPAWMLPAAGVAGGVALAGVVVFGVYGSLSHATYKRLRDRCGPHACGDADRSEADEAVTNQRIANIGFIVGVVGVVTAATLLALHLSSPRSQSSTRTRFVNEVNW